MAQLQNTITLNNKVSPALDEIAKSTNKAAEDFNKLSNSINRSGESAEAAKGSMIGFREVFAGSILANVAVGAVNMITDSFHKMVNTSEQFASFGARLNNIAGSQAKAAQLNDEIYESAQRARMGYEDMMESVLHLSTAAKNIFPDPQEALKFNEIVSKAFVVNGVQGEAAKNAMTQLTQALTSGVLQGDEFRSIAEQAPILEQYVADYMKVPRENLKKLASEGKITADIVHKAIMAAQDDVDAKFAAMPQTFSSLGTQIHNTLIRSFQPLFGLLTKLANAPEVKEFVAGIVNNIKFIAPIITGVFNVIIFSIRKVMAFFQQHAAVFGVLKAAMAVVAIGAGLLAAEYAAMGIAAAFAAIKTAVLNSALLTSPIIWIVLGIVALIIVIYQLINMYEEWAGTSVSVIGAIAALFAQFGVSVANIFVGLWNYIAAFVNFFANVWKDPLGAVQNLFIDIWNAIAGYVAKAVNNIIDSINKIPGMDKIFGGPIGHVDSLQLERVAINGGETTIMDRKDYIDASPYVDSAYNWGAGVGQGISDGISNAIGSLNNDIKMPGDDNNANTNDKRDAATQAAQDTAKNTGKTAKHTEKTAKALQLTADEIKNLHRSVQNDAIKEWSNRTIHINVTNNNKIDKDVNYGDFTTNFANGLIETVKRNTAEAL